MNAKRFVGLTLVAVAVAASGAAADVITYKGMGLNSTVKIDADGALVDGMTIYAGQIQIAYQGVDYDAYCVDINHYVGNGDVTEWSVGLLNRGDQVAWLLETYADTVATGNQAAGLQSAIWELVNEASGPFDLSKGDFRIEKNKHALAEGMAMLAGLPDTYAPQTELLVLHSDTRQDLIIGTGAPVPEPGTLTLIGAFGLPLALRRRRQAARA